jgi:hypothetical protein
MNEALAPLWALLDADGQAQLEAVSARFEPIVGLTKPNSQFRKDVAAALLVAIGYHRLDPRPKRLADVQKDFAKAAKNAARAAQEWRLAHARLGINELLDRAQEADAAVVNLENLANAARGKDRGGAPRKAAFAMLVDYLADAYEPAAGRRAEIHMNQRKGTAQGEFVVLIESAVLRVAKLAELCGSKFNHPSSEYSRARSSREVLRKRRQRLSTETSPASG